MHIVDARFVACVGERDFEVVRFLRSSARQVFLGHATRADLALAMRIRVRLKISELFVWSHNLHVDRILKLLLTFVLLARAAFRKFDELCDYLLVFAISSTRFCLLSSYGSELSSVLASARLPELTKLDDSLHSPFLDQFLLSHLELIRLSILEPGPLFPVLAIGALMLVQGSERQ